MKYSFCYSVKKVVNDAEIADPNRVHPLGSDVEFEFGPWRDTIDEAREDEQLFYADSERFFRLVAAHKDR